MKKVLFGILWLLLATSLFAANVRLAWDPMPAGEAWIEVRAYEVVGTTITLVGTAPAGTNTVTIPNVSVGTHTYVVRSYNGQEESPDSNQAQGIILRTPAAPTTITITITVP